MREAEGDADEENRLPAAEEAQQRLAGAAKGQLLDERRDRGEEDEVGREGAGVRGLPVDVRDPLLLARALRERQGRDGALPDEGRGDRPRRASPSALPPAPRPPQGEQVEAIDADQENDPEPDGVDDRPARERRVRVDLLARGALAAAASAGEAGRVVDQRRSPDEGGPDGEADVQRAVDGAGRLRRPRRRSIGFRPCVTSRRRRRTPSSSTSGRWWSSSSRPGWSTRPRSSARRSSRGRSAATAEASRPRSSPRRPRRSMPLRDASRASSTRSRSTARR